MPVAPLRSIVPEQGPRVALLLVALSAVGTGAVAFALTPETSSMRGVLVEPRQPVVPAHAARTTLCTDPAAGTWIANEYRPEQQDWIEHDLHIVAADGGYTVEHTARVRSGDAHGFSPMSCAPDAIALDTIGRAALDGDQLHVWGTSLVATHARCDGTIISYDLDSFTGPVAGDTFDSVNNDGNTAVNRPYHFRRVACE